MALTEDFELNIGNAEQQIDALGARLTQVAQTFQADLADSLTALDQGLTAEVSVSADTAAAEGDIQALEEDTTATVAVDADISGAEAEISTLEDEQVQLDVGADISSAESDISAL